MLNEIISDNSVEEVDNSKLIEEETSVDKTPSVDEKELKNYLSINLNNISTLPEIHLSAIYFFLNIEGCF